MWVSLIVILSPEFWLLTKWHCGRPLIFGTYDEVLRMRRAREYLRLRRLMAIDLSSRVHRREGCNSFFRFSFIAPDVDKGTYVEFTISPERVTSRIFNIEKELASNAV